MRIGILQTGHAPDEVRGSLGDYSDFFVRLLGGHDFTFKNWEVVDNVFPDSLDAVDGWLITGSRHGVYEDLVWLPRLEELIREIAASGKPLVGVCFGHQVIAQALGGKVEKFKGGWAVGRQEYDFGDAKLALNAWHQDQVVELPEGAQVIATNPFCRYPALVIGQNILTLQPHPEYDSAFIETLLEYRGKAVPADRAAAARATLGAPLANDEMANRMAAFLLKGAK